MIRRSSNRSLRLRESSPPAATGAPALGVVLRADAGHSRGGSIEALESRVLMSVAPVVAARLEAQGYERMTWRGQDAYVEPGQWILSLRGLRGEAGAQLAKANGLLSKFGRGLHAAEHLGADGLLRIDAPDAERFDELKTTLKRLPGFRSLEPNFAIWTQDALVPSDPGFPNAWGMNNTGQTGGTPDADIDAPEAWSISTGSADEVVGVIDTGVNWNHPDLAANIWRNPLESGTDAAGRDKSANGVDDDGNGYVDDYHGWDFGVGDNNPADVAHHGTHVAGIIAAAGDNGTGVTGVNWNAKILPLKIFTTSDSATLDAAIEALYYVAGLKARGVGIHVTNNSWGFELPAGNPPPVSLRDAIQANADAGILFVAAAGNGGSDQIADDNDRAGFYPASYDLDNIVSVAATDARDGLWSSSNFGGKTVDLGAPGHGIYSTTNTTAGYNTLSGTSMATPHVAGVAALGWSVRSNATYRRVRDALLGGVDAAPALAGKTVTGGRLNAYNTLRRLLPASVVARHTFYNGSAFDGNNTAANAQDDAAVAADKVALLPGQTATFANYTSFSKGLTGVMIDVRGLKADTALTSADFSFNVGNSNTPSAWSAGPAPTAIQRRPGAGVGGSDRVTITFANNAVAKRWLQVTMLPTDNTNLAAPDVFYFGNAAAESGNSATDARVTYADETGARSHPRSLSNPAPISYRWDYNRDRLVNATDQMLARSNATTAATALRLIIAPGTTTVPVPAATATTGPTSTQPVAVVPASAAPPRFGPNPSSPPFAPAIGAARKRLLFDGAVTPGIFDSMHNCVRAGSGVAG